MPKRSRRRPRRVRRRQRMLEAAEVDIGREIQAILHDAANGVVRVVGLGPIVVFSAPCGAWQSASR